MAISDEKLLELFRGIWTWRAALEKEPDIVVPAKTLRRMVQALTIDGADLELAHGCSKAYRLGYSEQCRWDGVREFRRLAGCPDDAIEEIAEAIQPEMYGCYTAISSHTRKLAAIAYLTLRQHDAREKAAAETPAPKGAA